MIPLADWGITENAIIHIIVRLGRDSTETAYRVNLSPTPNERRYGL